MIKVKYFTATYLLNGGNTIPIDKQVNEFIEENNIRDEEIISVNISQRPEPANSYEGLLVYKTNK